MSDFYLFFAMIIMAICTFALRALPFIALRNKEKKPMLLFFGELMPPGIMLILVVYSISNINFSQAPHGAPSLISIPVVIVVHHLLRKPPLSIGLGTSMHIFLLQWF